MTKKSQGRQLRDLQKSEAEARAKARANGEVRPDQVNLENNSCWDDLNVIHKDCTRLLAENGNIANYLRDTELMSYVDNLKLLIANADQLRRDMEQMNTELSQIFATHSDRTGGATDGQDLLSSYQMFEHYNLFTQRHQSVLMPTVYHILEQIQTAETKMQNKKNETNVDVITDVEVKEVVEAEVIATQ